jgi:hypothetical protein
MISTKVVPGNACVSIRDNLDPHSNVTKQTDRHFTHHPHPYFSTLSSTIGHHIQNESPLFTISNLQPPLQSFTAAQKVLPMRPGLADSALRFVESKTRDAYESVSRSYGDKPITRFRVESVEKALLEAQSDATRRREVELRSLRQKKE